MKRLLINLLLLFTIAGCELSDGDRCKGELVWDKRVKLCHFPDSTNEENDTALQQGSGTTDAAIDSSTGSTFGSMCATNADCNGDVDYCLIDPLNPNDPGVCTLENCVPDDCPADYQCCDCSALGATIACVPNAAVGTATLIGCQCTQGENK